ncbi:MAG: caspase family protein [Cytophagales bacterium]|nr:MAG: caspase family protein [Cytophagales bacterium]
MKSTFNILILISFFVFIQNKSKAQDLIHLKTGEIIKCKILLNDTYAVRYKKWEFLDGPRYVKQKSEIKSITLEKTETIATPIKAESKAVAENSSNAPATPINTTNSKPVDDQKEYITSKMKDIKNYALVIANQDYMDNSINDLDHPINDAKKIIKILSEKYTFDQPNINFLQNPDRAEIIRSFDKLAQKITPNDNLLIFYAGHGIWDNQLKKGYWLPKNARQNDRSDWFSNSDLRDYIGGINSKHTLLIADACFSGSIFKTREAFTHSTEANVALELFKTPSRQAMTSGAMKSVPDKSVFIEYLCKRLSENQETFLGTEQLFGSFKIAVMNNSANGQIPQFGVIKESGDEGGDFVFIKR